MKELLIIVAVVLGVFVAFGSVYSKEHRWYRNYTPGTSFRRALKIKNPEERKRAFRKLMGQ